MLPIIAKREGPVTEARGFQTTHWSIVLGARGGNGADSEAALATLCSIYWYPLYAFVRRSGLTRHDAEDLIQGFFYVFLRGDSLRNVNRLAGKFRSYLLACLKNFMANQWRRAQAQRRGGGSGLLSLDSDDTESRYLREPADHLTPEAIYERQWAFAVLEQTMAELRHEHSSGPKREQFEQLEGFLPGGKPSPSRAELAAQRGVSLGAIDVAIHRLRQRFGALLRSQVARTVSSEGEVEEEIRYLISVLGT